MDPPEPLPPLDPRRSGPAPLPAIDPPVDHLVSVAQRAELQRYLRVALEPDPDGEFVPGMRVGGYELIERLGSGATSVVFRARHDLSPREVALKLLCGADFATDVELRRFEAGAAAVAELEHPNIVAVLELGEHDGQPYVAMDLKRGGSLRDSFASYRQSEVKSAALVVKIARAVHHAHERGVLHRDLKPENILLEGEEPSLADFGLAKRLSSQGTSPCTAVMGTVEYMAPEQAAGDPRGLTFAADVWSLGVIFYELLTGHVPFEDDSISGVLAKLTSAVPVRPVREIEARVSREMALVCQRCLEKDVGARYRTAAEVADDLELLLDDRRPEHLAPAPRRPLSPAVIACSPLIELHVSRATTSLPPP